MSYNQVAQDDETAQYSYTPHNSTTTRNVRTDYNVTSDVPLFTEKNQEQFDNFNQHMFSVKPRSYSHRDYCSGQFHLEDVRKPRSYSYDAVGRAGKYTGLKQERRTPFGFHDIPLIESGMIQHKLGATSGATSCDDGFGSSADSIEQYTNKRKVRQAQGTVTREVDKVNILCVFFLVDALVGLCFTWSFQHAWVYLVRGPLNMGGFICTWSFIHAWVYLVRGHLNMGGFILYVVVYTRLVLYCTWYFMQLVIP